MNIENGTIIDEKDLETLSYDDVKKHIRLSKEEYDLLSPLAPEERLAWYKKINGKKEFISNKLVHKSKQITKRRKQNKLKNSNRRKNG